MAPKNCREVVDLIMDYVDDALAKGERKAVEDHLSICPPCVAMIRSYKEVPRIVRQATGVQMPAESALRLKKFMKGRIEEGP